MNSEFVIPDPSPFLEVAFFSFAFLTALSLPLSTWRATRKKQDVAATACLVSAWIVGTGLLTKWSGFRAFDPPPPFAITLVVGLVGVTTMIFSPIGTRVVRGLSLAGLVLFQAFRFPLEVLMHRAYTEGLMPVQMSFEGRNLDILTGISALALGLALVKTRIPNWLVWVWNILGLGLLLNIVTVAFLSAPTPWRQFHNDPPNIWILDVPFVWLPMVMVLAAFWGHLAVARKLSENR